MSLPNCYEADHQAEAREAEWDRQCEDFPHCAKCGGSLYPYDTYTELGGQLYCENCVERNTHSTADLEVFQ
jgi:hypothetical protein